MKTRLWLGALLVGFPMACVSGALGAGCGGSSDDSTGNTSDASQDVTAKDTSTADVVQIQDAGRCDDADLNTLSLPDASLGDSGASVGTCLGCTRASCSEQITECNKDCECKNGIDDALNCVAEQGTLSASCVGSVGNDTNAQALGECIYLSCQNECGLGGFSLDGGDGGDGG